MAQPRGKSKKPIVESASENSASEASLPSPTWNDIGYFKPRDFTCRCEGLCDHPSVISMNLVAKLDAVRKLIGMPFTILSGTRCELYNRKVGGKPLSSHIAKSGISHAADVLCPDAAFRFAFLTAALPMFNRIGLGKDFIHVDDDPNLPAGVIWVT